MKVTIKDINSIIELCHGMISYIAANGKIYPGNSLYSAYKKEISSFFDLAEIEDKKNYLPYIALDKLFFRSSAYTVDMNEAKEILYYVRELKRDLFVHQFEKIFISHREVDKEQVDLFIDLLHAMGIPRPTASNPEKTIFCTSHPEGYITNGEPNLDTIKKEFNNEFHTFFILWYTDNYFSSQACLNEMGAIWVTNKKYQEILMPKFDNTHIKGLLDKQAMWFRANDKYRLNDFKKQVETMFCLSPLEQNSWELARDKFIKGIENF